jgi:hypothetical protein
MLRNQAKRRRKLNGLRGRSSAGTKSKSWAKNLPSVMPFGWNWTMENQYLRKIWMKITMKQNVSRMLLVNFKDAFMISLKCFLPSIKITYWRRIGSVNQ